MNILIHGAVNGSNFGDCLYAQIYNDIIKGIDGRIKTFFWQNRLFGASNHLKSISNFQTSKEIKSLETLIFMPGGYFGDGPTIYRRIKQYFRFFRLGEKFARDNKNIIVSGVGGERSDSTFLLNKILNIFNNSTLITVRNKKTADFYQKYVNNEIINLFDPILHVRNMELPELNSDLKELLEKCRDKKKIFLHVHSRNFHNENFVKNVIPALNKYVSKNNSHVFVGTDYISRRPIKDLDIYNSVKSEKSTYEYSTPLNLCAMLKECDIVITPKLHVGVVSSVFNKSVISFAVTPLKTKTFYEEIGYPERSIALYETTPEKAYNKIIEFADAPIQIPTELLKKSDENFVLLKSKILDLMNGN